MDSLTLLAHMRKHKQQQQQQPLASLDRQFASHAFHPIDGFSQSLPYHLFVLAVPLHKWTYLLLFVAVNVWTVSIHDGVYQVPAFLDPFVNGKSPLGSALFDVDT
jgi:lathosterol oxidase